MKRSLFAGAVFVAALGLAATADAQAYYPPSPSFELRPALPESMPTWSRDETSGTAQHDIAATPNCGAANPQGGIPSLASGTCP